MKSTALKQSHSQQQIGFLNQNIHYGSSIGIDVENTQSLIKKINKGFPFKVIEHLQKILDINLSSLAEILQIKERTLARRKAGRLQPDESERVYRLARLIEMAWVVLGSQEDAVAWFKMEQRSLNNQIPLYYSSTEPGAREVERLINQLHETVLP